MSTAAGRSAVCPAYVPSSTYSSVAAIASAPVLPRTSSFYGVHLRIGPTFLSRRRRICAIRRYKRIVSEENYQFRDDGAEVELRVKLPPEHAQVTAKNIVVNSQDTSLSVALVSKEAVRTLLHVEDLYGRIKAAETVWYVDDEEVVLGLKKADVAQPWPGLLEAWEFLGKGVINMLKGTAVYIVGESTEINLAVAKELAGALRFVPLGTKQLMEELLKSPIDQLTDAEVADLEAQILSKLSPQFRVVVATLGGKRGAAADPKNWRHLHSGITIWLSQTRAQNKESAEAEAVNTRQQGTSPYARAELVVALGGWEEGAARPAAEGCLKALKYLIESDNELPGKKKLYVRLGARGDWPDIMPPGWDPSKAVDAPTSS